MKRALALVALGLLLTAGACTQQILGAVAQDRVEKTLPLAKGGSFSLQNVNGDLVVTLGKEGEVRLVADKKVKALDQERAQKVLGQLEVAVDARPASISVETRYPKFQGAFGGTGFSVSVAYTVEVPPGTQVSLTTVNGAVRVDAPGSQVSCETTNGSVKVGGARVLKAVTVNGKIEFMAENVDEVSSTNGSVEGTVQATRPSSGKVETVNGRVALRLPADAAVRVEAENVNGNVQSGFPGLKGSKHSLSGDLNSGGQTLSIETVNGSISVDPAGKI
jgi:DUF4097 and DUF4098 domain-containing protein YvlB